MLDDPTIVKCRYLTCEYCKGLIDTTNSGYLKISVGSGILSEYAHIHCYMEYDVKNKKGSNVECIKKD